MGASDDTISRAGTWGGMIVISVPTETTLVEQRILRAAFKLAMSCTTTVLSRSEAAAAIGFQWAEKLTAARALELVGAA